MKGCAVQAFSAVVIVLFVVQVSAAADMLPNIRALPAEDMCLSTSGGKTFLQFSTTTWNSGEGPLELVAGKASGKSKKQKVYQRIYSDSGFRDARAGFLVWHPSHNHFHFEDYAYYILKPVDAPGASARIAVKTTFCIIDSRSINSETEPHYTNCGKDVQGMSVGWGDIYRYDLSGQEIDVTYLPDGQYLLEIIADPKDKLIELDDADNTSAVPIVSQPSSASISFLSDQRIPSLRLFDDTMPS